MTWFRLNKLTWILTLAASVFYFGCAAGDSADVSTDSDIIGDTDSTDAALIRDAFDTLLGLAPASCQNFCQSSVDCQFAVGDLSGASSHVDLVHDWAFESCVLRCTYPLIEGSYLYETDPTSGEQTVERIVEATEYEEFTGCLESLDAHICLDGAFQLGLTDDLLCAGLTQCLAAISTYDASCQWDGAPESGSCNCSFEKEIPDFAPWLGGAQ